MHTRTRLLTHLLAVFAMLCISAGTARADTAALIGRPVVAIDVAGHTTIEETTLRGAMSARVGDPLSDRAVADDVRKIFALGFFRDVVVEAEPDGDGVRLTYRVEELPNLSAVTFEGNDKVLEETLKGAAAGLTEGVFLAPDKLIKAREGLLDEYADAGFRRAQVVPVQVVTRSEGGDRVDLSFVIEEGDKTKIGIIRVEGNEAFSDRILKKRLKTRERFWLTSWITDSGIYKPAQVQDDLLRLEDYYQDHGYPEVVVSEPVSDLSADLRWQTLTYPVQEGRLYHMGEVRYEHAGKVPEAELTADLTVRAGNLYDRSAIRADRARITDVLGEHGYAFAQVTPDPVPRPEDGLMDIAFRVDEGEQVRIRRINISGNTKTRDKVIRREVRQQEGEIINTALLRRSFQRINNLNFFESIDIVPVEVGSGELDLDVKVKEKSTGQFSVGGGYSSVDGLVGLAEVTQGNLGGRGQTLSGRFERSGRRTVYNLRFQEPYLFDTTYSAGFDLFNTARDFESYEETRTGGSVTLGKSVGEYVSGALTYSLEAVDIKVLDATAPSIITSQAGSSTTGALGFSLTRDARDNFMDPTRGTRNVLAVEVADNALGGTNQFWKGSIESSAYLPLFKGSALSFRNLVGMGRGFGGKALPPGERYFVGGMRTVRGFGFGEAGPLATNGDPVGGPKEWVMSAELAFPLVAAANLKGALFVDWGAGFDDGQSFSTRDLNLTWGYEIRWISPLGPLRFGFGWVLDDQRPAAFQNGGEQLFTIGTFF
ncbi:MAG: outer membrane protein assembly factor BamA [Nitrospirae bacterium]|nr:outer membrane protein assembly factor BamA [Nitrospirota bacterium]